MNMNMQPNNVKMIVNLGTKPTVKTVSGGRRMARFSAAAIEPDDTGKSKVKWYSVVSWGKVADMAGRCLEKGKRVMVCGHLITRTWTDKKGIQRTRHEIVATNLILLHSGKSATLPNAA